jgi:hypothetical protein
LASTRDLKIKGLIPGAGGAAIEKIAKKYLRTYDLSKVLGHQINLIKN